MRVLRWAWKEQLAVAGPAAIAVIIAFVVALQWVKPAPPKQVVIATGRSDGAYYRYAQLYRERLAKAGVTMEVRETSGSVENIRLLEDPRSGVDIAFVQGGTASAAAKTDSLLRTLRVSWPGFNRHRQLPLAMPGRLNRASLPRPRRSCAGTIAVSATEPMTARMKCQWTCPSSSKPR